MQALNYFNFLIIIVIYFEDNAKKELKNREKKNLYTVINKLKKKG